MDFTGRAGIVTGAARGIGAAIAARLAREGAQVAIADIDAQAARQAAEQIGTSGGKAFAVQVDVSNPASVQAMVQEVVAQASKIDFLVNNAGIAGNSIPVVDYPEEEWLKVINIDLNGVFYCCKAVVKQMLPHKYGRIVNVASIAGKEGNPNLAAYSAAKAGVIGFTKALGKELATSGILVNSITPAVIETDILKQVTPEMVQYMVSRIPIGRTGQPDEVAALVAWLCSEECSFSTAAVFDISGGRATY